MNHVLISLVIVITIFSSINANAVSVTQNYEYRNVFNLEESKMAAIDYTSDFINTNYDKYKWHFVRGILYSYLQIDISKAKKEFKEVVRIRPNHYLSYLNLGYLSLDTKNSQAEEAISYFRKALSYATDKPEIYNALAVSYISQKNNDGALTILEEGINNISNDESLYFNQAVILLELFQGHAKQNKIVRNMNAAIKLHPREEYYAILGYYYLSVNNNLEARNALNNALKFDPNNIITILGIATTYKNTNQFESAIGLAKQALKIEPNNKLILDELKEYEEAYKVWKETQKP
jgi:Tfp pilus assembly protein PilF